MTMYKDKKVKKVVIPVAGLGTRFLPATKAQPKEMLPVLDKPIIQYIVEAAVSAGMTDVILVTGPTKRAIEDHFDASPELEAMLAVKGKKAVASEIKKISQLANFVYIRQKGPYGNGTPVLNAAGVIGDEPFAVVYGDDIWLTPDGKPHLSQLLETFYHYGDPVITALPVTAEMTKHYGVIDGTKIEKDVYQVKRIVEKPGPKRAPSHIASFGGYVLTPDIFRELKKTKVGKGNELWMVDAITNLGKKRPIYAKLMKGQYLDTGSKVNWLKANIEIALADKNINGEFKRYLKKSLS